MLEKIGLPAKPAIRGNNWVVDASHCQGCSSQFTFINRKVLILFLCLIFLSLIPSTIFVFSNQFFYIVIKPMSQNMFFWKIIMIFTDVAFNSISRMFLLILEFYDLQCGISASLPKVWRFVLQWLHTRKNGFTWTR